MPGEVKSTLELAMEKAARLPRLTKEEIREQREKELAPRARTTAARFLSGDLNGEEIAAEVMSYQKEDGEIFRHAFLESLFEPIVAGEAGKTERAVEGIRALLDVDHAEQATSRLNSVLREYERRKGLGLAEMEASETERLRALGISGSAIRINLQGCASWKQREVELREEFGPKLDEIKLELIRHMAALAR